LRLRRRVMNLPRHPHTFKHHRLSWAGHIEEAEGEPVSRTLGHDMDVPVKPRREWVQGCLQGMPVNPGLGNILGEDAAESREDKHSPVWVERVPHFTWTSWGPSKGWTRMLAGLPAGNSVTAGNVHQMELAFQTGASTPQVITLAMARPVGLKQAVNPAGNTAATEQKRAPAQPAHGKRTLIDSPFCLDLLFGARHCDQTSPSAHRWLSHHVLTKAPFVFTNAHTTELQEADVSRYARWQPRVSKVCQEFILFFVHMWGRSENGSAHSLLRVKALNQLRHQLVISLHFQGHIFPVHFLDVLLLCARCDSKNRFSHSHQLHRQTGLEAQAQSSEYCSTSHQL